MFQSINREKFLRRANFSHWDTGDAIQMHRWLQKNGWPSSNFVDMYMRCHVNFDPSIDLLGFKVFLESQYLWIATQEVAHLRSLVKIIDSARFSGVDSDHLIEFVNNLISKFERA